MDDECLVNLKHAAAYLGVSTKTVTRRVRDGSLAGRKVGRQHRFHPQVLRDFNTSARPVPPVPDDGFRAALSALRYDDV